MKSLDHDLITDDQLENPTPQTVCDALETIAAAYDDATLIWEHVPNGRV